MLVLLVVLTLASARMDSVASAARETRNSDACDNPPSSVALRDDADIYMDRQGHRTLVLAFGREKDDLVDLE